MRLLNAQLRHFEEFDPDEIPAYAILSHTWARGQEVSYAEFLEESRGKSSSPSPPPAAAATVELNGLKSGFGKIDACCRRALADGLSYVWIDTCCIEKSSSAELSEAINSMFEWYRRSQVCYVHLSDVFVGGDNDDYDGDYVVIDEESNNVVGVGNSDGDHANGQEPQKARTLPFPLEQFRDCRWWTRGWTLQELIAPDKVVFFDARWTWLGEKKAMAKRIAGLTGIDAEILRGERSCFSASLAKRMSWAAGRQTTRPEDEAYCLMGLFECNMAMIYGEGRKAFLRLQELIMKNQDDQSLFAWTDPGARGKARSGLLAPSPLYFRNSASVVPFVDDEGSEPFAISNKGLNIELHLSHIWGQRYFRASLCCRLSNKLYSKCLCIYLEKVNPRQYFRILPQNHIQAQDRGKLQRLFVPQAVNSSSLSRVTYLELREGPSMSEYRVQKIYPVVAEANRRLDSTLHQGMARRESDGSWIPTGMPFRWELNREPGSVVGHIILMHIGTREMFTVSLGSNWESGFMFDVDTQSRRRSLAVESEMMPTANIALTKPANTSCLLNGRHLVEINVEWENLPWGIMCFVNIKIEDIGMREKKSNVISTVSLKGMVSF